jgi:hypothetical protein
MEITKKQWTIIGVVVAIIAVWYFFLRKKKVESNFRMPFRGNYSVPGGPANPPIPSTEPPIKGEPVNPMNPPINYGLNPKLVHKCFLGHLKHYQEDLDSSNPLVRKQAQFRFRERFFGCIFPVPKK